MHLLAPALSAAKPAAAAANAGRATYESTFAQHAPPADSSGVPPLAARVHECYPGRCVNVSGGLLMDRFVDVERPTRGWRALVSGLAG